MRVLVLDDDDVRHARFDAALAGNEIVHSREAVETCDILSMSERFDMVYLDHDLGDTKDKSYSSGVNSLTGFDVARFIARGLAVQKRPHRVVVHSFNPPGAKMMVDILREASIEVSYEPFHF